MTHLKISIVTPSYNQGQYLEDTILSVLGQQYPNLEYIIYDGGSTDESVNIIKKYENQISYWQSQRDKGQSDAINQGFSRSTGEILMWLNSDDILMPNVLNLIANQHIAKGDGIFFGNCIHFKELNPSGVHASGSNVIAKSNSVSLDLSDYIIQPCSFWSRKVWNDIGKLDENFHFGFDWEWFLRAQKNGIPFHAINKPISMYRFHEEHKSGTGGKKRQEEILKIYQVYNPFYANLYRLMMNETFIFSFSEKVLFRLFRLMSRKEFSKIQFLKIIKNRQYAQYSANDIQTIIGML